MMVDSYVIIVHHVIVNYVTSCTRLVSKFAYYRYVHDTSNATAQEFFLIAEVDTCAPM